MICFVWLRQQTIIRLHKRQLERHGGADGILSIGSLESALQRPMNVAQYEGVESVYVLAAYYAHGVGKAHAFHDGNKRVAFQAALTFLALNGVKRGLSPRGDTHEELQVLALITDKLSIHDFAEWLERWD